MKRRPRFAKAIVFCALFAVVGTPLLTVPADAGSDGRARCHAGKSNGFRLYCHVAVKFTLDARKFSFKGGKKGDELKIGWVDNKGTTDTTTAKIQ